MSENDFDSKDSNHNFRQRLRDSKIAIVGFILIVLSLVLTIATSILMNYYDIDYIETSIAGVSSIAISMLVSGIIAVLLEYFTKRDTEDIVLAKMKSYNDILISEYTSKIPELVNVRFLEDPEFYTILKDHKARQVHDLSLTRLMPISSLEYEKIKSIINSYGFKAESDTVSQAEITIDIDHINASSSELDFTAHSSAKNHSYVSVSSTYRCDLDNISEIKNNITFDCRHRKDMASLPKHNSIIVSNSDILINSIDCDPEMLRLSRNILKSKLSIDDHITARTSNDGSNNSYDYDIKSYRGKNSVSNQLHSFINDKTNHIILYLDFICNNANIRIRFNSKITNAKVFVSCDSHTRHKIDATHDRLTNSINSVSIQFYDWTTISDKIIISW